MLRDDMSQEGLNFTSRCSGGAQVRCSLSPSGEAGPGHPSLKRSGVHECY